MFEMKQNSDEKSQFMAWMQCHLDTPGDIEQSIPELAPDVLSIIIFSYLSLRDILSIYSGA